jgi:hypothetical protein
MLMIETTKLMQTPWQCAVPGFYGTLACIARKRFVGEL